MSEGFDPYRTWLGISPHERPASHYRLLGVSLFEHDPAVIAGAADRQMAYIRSFASGPRAGYTQGLLNEITAAKLCLLDPRQKGDYDAALRNHLAAFLPQPLPSQPAMAPPAGPPPPPAAIPSAAPRAVASAPAPAEGSSGTWMLAAAALLLLFLVGGFAVVLIALANRPPTPMVQPMPPGRPPMPGPPVAEVAPEPLVVHQEGDGSVNLAPSAATFFGPAAKLVEESGAAHLEGFVSPEDRAEWLVQLARPGFFRIEITYAADTAAAGGQWRLASDDREKRATIRDTGGKTMFITEDGGFLAFPRSGRVTISFSSVRGAAGVFVVEKIRLVPRSQ